MCRGERFGCLLAKWVFLLLNTIRSNTSAIWCKELSQDPNAGKDWRQKKRVAEDEMVSVTDSMDMNLSKLQEIVENRDAWCAAAQRVAESDMAQWLNNNKAETKQRARWKDLEPSEQKWGEETPTWKTRSGGKGLCDELSEGTDPRSPPSPEETICNQSPGERIRCLRHHVWGWGQ